MTPCGSFSGTACSVAIPGYALEIARVAQRQDYRAAQLVSFWWLPLFGTQQLLQVPLPQRRTHLLCHLANLQLQQPLGSPRQVACPQHCPQAALLLPARRRQDKYLQHRVLWSLQAPRRSPLHQAQLCQHQTPLQRVRRRSQYHQRRRGLHRSQPCLQLPHRRPQYHQRLL